MADAKDGGVAMLRGQGITHGFSHTPEYRTWRSMKNRCLNAKGHEYRNYGERGITICAEWVNSFEAFYSDMGRKPSPKHSIERVNVNGNYEPSNCIWATFDVQWRNRRNIKLTDAKAQEIRTRCANGESAYSIACEYGVTTAAIYAITGGRAWAKPEQQEAR
jgi:hypothetical protein